MNPDRDQELRDEIESHLSLDVRERMARGATQAEAEAAARKTFGNMGQVSEVTRGMWQGATLERWRRDLRQAFRGLRRTPSFAIVATLTLALAIGANTAIFTVVHGVLGTPLPFPKPDQLVYITSKFTLMGLDHFPLDAGEFLELQERNHSFKDVGAYAITAANVGSDDHLARVTTATASPSLFNALGASFLQGRNFTAEESAPNGPPVVILSYEIWQSIFGGAPVLGKSVMVNATQRTVVGILPRNFDVHDQGVQLWLPTRLSVAEINSYRGGHGYTLIARLRDNVTLAQARAELGTLLTQWPAADGATPPIINGTKLVAAPTGPHTPNNTGHPLRYDNLRDDMIGGVARALWVLQVAVALVLLIACANLANLLLMRAESRQRELGVRIALGAGRGHLIRQFLAEGLTLAFGGAVLGIALAQLGLHALMSSYASSIPRMSAIALDLPVLGFAVAITVGATLLFALAPLLHLGGRDTTSLLRDGGTRSTAGGARRSAQRGLVIAEIAMAVTLVTGAGLLVRSVRNLLSVDTGFAREHLTTFRVSLPPQKYADSSLRVRTFTQMVDQLGHIPGVTAAAAMQGMPPQRPINANDTQFENFTPQPGGPQNNVDYWQWITPSYIRTMGIPVISGRAFTDADGPAAPPVVLINQTLAHRYYPGVDPIGKRVKPGGATEWFTIVGVVKDVKQQGIEAATGTELYLNYAQTTTYLGGFTPPAMCLVLRSTLSPGALATQIRGVVSAIDPLLPVDQLQSMDDVILASVSRPRFIATLLGVFAALAITLAAVGTYGVLAYAVSQREREIGIRMALGARVDSVLSMVLRQGMATAGIGIAAGLAGAALLTRITQSLLFGVNALDPATFAVVAGTMTVVVMGACLIPARRAAHVDPIVALRGD